jgi:hypothetical protein
VRSTNIVEFYRMIDSLILEQMKKGESNSQHALS